MKVRKIGSILLAFIMVLTVWGVNPLTTVEAATFNDDIFVEEIEVCSENDLNTVGVDGTLQMIASVSPKNTTLKSISWSVENGSGKATIDSSGLLTGIDEGVVTVVATADDGSGVEGRKVIDVTEAITNVSSIEVTGINNANIVMINETLQMIAKIDPEEATNKDVTWSVLDKTGAAKINQSGLLKGKKTGTVTVTATANDGSGVSESIDMIVWDATVPFILVFRDHNFLCGGEWQSESKVSIDIHHDLTVEKFNVTADSEGNFCLWDVEFPLVTGDRIVVSDNIVTKEQIVGDLEITNVNYTEKYIEGTAMPGSTLEYRTTFTGIYKKSIVIDDSGTWMIDLSKEVVLPGFTIWLSQLDYDKNITRIQWNAPNPCIEVYRNHNGIGGDGWTYEPLVNVEIFNGDESVFSGSVIPNADGYFNLREFGYSLVIGDLIVVSDSFVTKELIVGDLEVVELNYTNKSLQGTAMPGSILAYETNREDSYTQGIVVDDSGTWTFDLSDEELVPGFEIYIVQGDEDGDGTIVDWRALEPKIYADRDNGDINGDEWESDSSVNIEIFSGDESVYSDTITTDGEGHFAIWDFGYSIVIGDRIVVSYGDVTKELIVGDIEITDVNYTEEYIEGTAMPGSTLGYGTNREGPFTEGIVVGDSGTWKIELPDEEMEPGFTIEVSQLYDDDDGDKTCDRWNPQMRVFRDSNIINVEGWISYSTVLVDIYHGNTSEPFFSYQVTTDARGSFMGLRDLGYSLVAEDRIVVSYGDTFKEHIVGNLAISDVNFDDGSIQVTGTPGSKFDYQTISEYAEDVVLDDNGTWTIYLSVGDLISGFWIEVSQTDDDGDLSVDRWEIAYPSIAVFKEFNKIDGHNWLSDSTVTIEIYDGTSQLGDEYSLTTDSNGNFALEVSSAEVTVGYKIVVYDEISSKEHIIGDLVITEVNVTTKYIYGTVTPGSTLEYSTSTDEFNSDSIVVDIEGNWNIYLSGEVLIPGFSVVVSQFDVDRDRTSVKWEMPNPE